MNKKTIIFALTSAFVASQAFAVSNKMSTLTDDEFKLLYGSPNIPACLWTYENGAATAARLGTPDGLVKPMLAKCNEAQAYLLEVGKKHGYNRHFLNGAKSNLIQTPYADRYKVLFPDWEKNTKKMVEEVEENCGDSCKSYTPNSTKSEQEAAMLEALRYTH